jgi:hypothetical protein
VRDNGETSVDQHGATGVRPVVPWIRFLRLCQRLAYASIWTGSTYPSQASLAATLTIFREAEELNLQRRVRMGLLRYELDSY